MSSQQFPPCNPEQLRRARRRLRFVTAENASKILRHDRYWTSAFWALYLDECRYLRLEQPLAARSLTRHAPALVVRIRDLGMVADSPRSELFRSADEACSAEVRSWVLLADCERLCAQLGEARKILSQAMGLASRAPRISLSAAAELRRVEALLEISEGELRAGFERLLRLRELLRSALGRAQRISDEIALLYAETLLLLGSSPLWFKDASQRQGHSAGHAAALPVLQAGNLADLAECAAFARPRLRLGEPIFDAALDLLDQRLDGPRAAPDVLESAGRWLRRARRQPFKRGERLRRSRLIWVEGRVLSLLGISRLAERRLLRVKQSFEQEGESLRLALVTLDLVLLDIGRDDRETASRRLIAARDRLQESIEHSELSELLQQARRASYDSLLVFRRRLARHLGTSPTGSLIPRPQLRAAAPWSAPSLGGVA